MTEHSSDHSLGLEEAIESLLFVSDEDLGPDDIASVLDSTTAIIEARLHKLQSEYASRGIHIIEHQGKYRMVSHPHASLYCRKLLGLDPTTKLTQASLETLAIIAYRQPVSRGDLERIRGVNCDSSLSNLLSRGLVKMIGRSDRIGRPQLYGTSPSFLMYFGIDSLTSLPSQELLADNHPPNTDI